MSPPTGESTSTGWNRSRTQTLFHHLGVFPHCYGQSRANGHSCAVPPEAEASHAVIHGEVFEQEAQFWKLFLEDQESCAGSPSGSVLLTAHWSKPLKVTLFHILNRNRPFGEVSEGFL